MHIETKPHVSLVIHQKKGWDVNRWCEKFNLRSDELKEIIKRVGPELENIREYLTKRNLKAPLRGPFH